MANIEKVKKDLKECLSASCRGYHPRLSCPYNDEEWDVVRDALSVIEELQAEIERTHQKWIPVSERLPEEKETIFAKLKGTDKWRSAMFEKMSDDVRIVAVFSDGTRIVSHSHTVDGKWECEKSPVKRTVTHWMPNPEPPEEG